MVYNSNVYNASDISSKFRNITFIANYRLYICVKGGVLSFAAVL